MGYAKRVDSNQKVLVEHARKLGASVQHLHGVHKGCPDICIGFQGKNFLVEIKKEKTKLNELQVIWHSDWKGHCCVVRTKEEIESLIGVR